MKFPKHIPKLQRYDHFRLCILTKPNHFQIYKKKNIKYQEVKINRLTRQSLILLQRSTDKIHELTQARNAAKLSSSRVVSIGKELKELTKVLSQYCEN